MRNVGRMARVACHQGLSRARHECTPVTEVGSIGDVLVSVVDVSIVDASCIESLVCIRDAPWMIYGKLLNKVAIVVSLEIHRDTCWYETINEYNGRIVHLSLTWEL